MSGAKILKMLVLPDGNTTIIIQGQKRFKILTSTREKPFIKAKYEILYDLDFDLEKENTEAIVQSLKDTANKIMKLNQLYFCKILVEFSKSTSKLMPSPKSIRRLFGHR